MLTIVLAALVLYLVAVGLPALCRGLWSSR